MFVGTVTEQKSGTIWSEMSRTCFVKIYAQKWLFQNFKKSFQKIFSRKFQFLSNKFLEGIWDGGSNKKNGGKCELIFEWIYASPQAFCASQGGTPNTFHSDMASQNLFDGHENISSQLVKYDIIEWIIYFIRSGYWKRIFYFLENSDI